MLANKSKKGLDQGLSPVREIFALIASTDLPSMGGTECAECERVNASK
jgi:hypothetical protein